MLIFVPKYMIQNGNIKIYIIIYYDDDKGLWQNWVNDVVYERMCLETRKANIHDWCKKDDYNFFWCHFLLYMWLICWWNMDVGLVGKIYWYIWEWMELQYVDIYLNTILILSPVRILYN